jgi:glycosyltransferase involved in cell wall biosynthesis
MSKSYKVCFLLFNLDPGGLETYLLRFIKTVGHDLKIIVVLKSGRSGFLEDDYLNLGVELKFIKTGYLYIPGWIRVWKFLRREKFHSVVDLTGNFGGIYLFLSKAAGVQRRNAYYGLSSNHFEESRFNLLYNKLVNHLVYKYATRIISNTQAALNFFFSHKVRNDLRFAVIPNGVDSLEFSGEHVQNLRKQLGIPESAFVLLHVGRNDPNKNHSTILKVAELLIQKYDNFCVLLCGKDTEGLNSYISSKYINTRIFLLGYRKDVSALMGVSDIFYFPSISEGQPNALIEAILSGLPFIGADLPEIKEFLPIQYWDHLVPPNDVNGAIIKIEKEMNGNTRNSTKELKEWATSYFDSNKRFQEFKNLILS